MRFAWEVFVKVSVQEFLVKSFACGEVVFAAIFLKATFCEKKFFKTSKPPPPMELVHRLVSEDGDLQSNAWWKTKGSADFYKQPPMAKWVQSDLTGSFSHWSVGLSLLDFQWGYLCRVGFCLPLTAVAWFCLA